MAASEQQFDYVIVGSGAGGGTLAARLAENGFRVLILEAGGDPFKMLGRNPNPYSKERNRNTLPDDYQVPAFHAQASENEAMRWDFHVQHYKDPELQSKDEKFVPGKGILYPRGGNLGGCTAHNAMITVYPHNEDWQHIEKITGDSSWSPKNMRRYFERLENCRHRPLWKIWSWLGINPTRHGWRGWLHTEVSIPEAVLDDKKLKNVIVDSAAAEVLNAGSPFWERLKWAIFGKGDPNDWRLVRENAVGIRYLPMAMKDRARMGSRERVLETMKKHPDRLFVELDALATKVLFDENNRAIGVEYLKGKQLYRAHPKPNSDPGQRRQVHASREVILCGGTFNTPQLLMLSGIGPPEHLREYDIPVRVELPGVGQNLQDRYEIGVVNRMNFEEWWILKGARFMAGDPQYEEWKLDRKGVYTTNGVISAVFLRSSPERPLPDLFCFAILGPFAGYKPGYSAEFATKRNYLTWSILKAHTNNCSGTVRLTSADPREMPAINFCYFTEGTDDGGEDLQSVIAGIEFVRKLTKPLFKDDLIAEEELPGKKYPDLAEYVKTQSWGHHACGTCKIGDPNKNGVVNGNFEVHGTKGLRIVDASVFPKIPGFFIVSSIYTIAEKAADVITAAAKK